MRRTNRSLQQIISRNRPYETQTYTERTQDGRMETMNKWFRVITVFSYCLISDNVKVNTMCGLNKWMNEWCIYIALYCVLLYTQSTLQPCGGGLSSTTTSVQHPLGWCEGSHRTTAPVRSPHTSYRWRGERVIESIKWMGIIRRPWLTRASGGNLAKTPGLHPYSLREVPWDF